MKFNVLLKRNTLWLLPLALLLIAGLALAVRDFVRRALVEPAAALYWRIDLVLQSIPQSLLWSALLALLAIVIFKSFLVSREAPLQPEPDESPGERSQRVAFWLLQILQAARQPARSHFGDYFNRLILAVVSHQQRIPLAQAERFLLSDQAATPPELQAYFRPAGRSAAGRSPRLARRLKSLARPRPDSAAFQADLEKVIQFLEDQLEVPHDDRDR